MFDYKGKMRVDDDFVVFYTFCGKVCSVAATFVVFILLQQQVFCS